MIKDLSLIMIQKRRGKGTNKKSKKRGSQGWSAGGEKKGQGKYKKFKGLREL